MDTLKYKRQVRDWYNKNVHDAHTIDKVAEAISFPITVSKEVGTCCTQPNTDTVE